MIFSFLSAEEVDKITEVYNGNFSDGWNKEMLLSAFNGGRFYCLGIGDSDKLFGIITYSVAIDEADIEGIVTIKEHRGKGYAKALYEKVQTELIGLGVKKVFLEVRESNIPAKSLYEKCGFKDISVRKNYYADGENAVVMVKEL